MLIDPLKFQELMGVVHENAPIEEHFKILFRNITIRDKPFIDLISDCMAQSGTTVDRWKLFRRALRAFNLAQYFNYSLDLEGARVECGVYKGFSALLMAQIHRLHDPEFRGKDFHLIDSFEGLSELTPADAIGTRDTGNSEQQLIFGYEKGSMATPLESAQETMKSFPETEIHKGWMPQILETLPEQKWAFVHIDVDLYEPTIGCLEYFVPRMVKGGCILNDDFASPMFPGGFTGWRDFCDRRGLPYAILDSGQSVLICE